MSNRTTTVPLTEASLRDFAVAWYQALDRHDHLEAVQANLVPEGLEMTFPETTASGLEGFANWYRTVTHRFFDEIHQVRATDVVSLDGDRAEITVLVNWRASKWDAPAARSERLDFDAFQRWTVVAGPTGPQVSRYVVETFEPNPGSADL
jgi:spermidine synthase